MRLVSGFVCKTDKVNPIYPIQYYRIQIRMGNRYFVFCFSTKTYVVGTQKNYLIAPDKDWKQLGIYPPLFGLIGYFKF